MYVIASQLVSNAHTRLLFFFCPGFPLVDQAALMDRLKNENDNDNGNENDDDDDDDDQGGESKRSPSYTLVHGTLQKHLRLDSAAAAAVTLLPDPTAPHQYGSLYDILNRCGVLQQRSLLLVWWWWSSCCCCGVVVVFAHTAAVPWILTSTST